MTAIQWPARSSLIVLVLVLGTLILAGTKSAAKPGETPSGISEQRLERQYLVEPAFKKALEAAKAIESSRKKSAEKKSAEKEPAELVLPSGVPTVTPQTDPNLADGVNIKEETDSLIELYAAKYGVATSTLEQIVECESRYDPEATGSAGERGLAQFLFGTWFTTPQARFGWDAAYHPAVNIEAAAWMLSQGRAQEWTCLR